ncbi:type II CAAX prenyl endopeptidase Rce1 family protein [Simkania sp.]|uniref:CPBP family glutamic-type intramembrane protease n=1 Tax=Simkania sp. TaxID=34094 RepID=UPI003B51D776
MGSIALGSHYNLFLTSVLFGTLWALWHLPLFFVKGYYQNQLLQLGPIYVLNFFLSTFVIAFIMNWIFYQTGRSIPALILFHSMINLSAILFRTEPMTKCIATVLLCIVLVFVIVQNKATFFEKHFIVNPKKTTL